MRPLRLTTVSVLALVLAAGQGIAQETKTSQNRFPTEVLLRPAVEASAPALTGHGHASGLVGPPGRDGLGLDAITTGQIPNRDAETAADHLKVKTDFDDAAGPVETVDPSRDAPSEGPASAGKAAAAEDVPAPAAAGDAAPAEAAHAGTAPEGEHGGASQWASVRTPMPFDIIRTIEFLQDQVSRGNGRAIRVQAMLLKRFGPVFAQADPGVWADARNFRAAVLFVLSGGPPDVLRRIAAEASQDAGRTALVNGALAYLDNDLAGATTLLSGLDFTDMEPGLAAHVHLVLGQMGQLDHPEDAVRHLDQARLLAPGGLIEESALRMEVLLADGLGRHEAADRLARRYFDRYAASAYAENFEARFATLLATRGRTDAPAAVATMLDLTARLPDAARRALFLSVGRRALVDGNLEFANLTANEALRTSDIPDADKQRASLYTVAATVGSSAATEAAGELGKIDRSKLYPEDVKLLDAAYSILKGIDQPPEPGEAPSGPDQDAETSPVFDRAQQLLSEVASDLGKAQP